MITIFNGRQISLDGTEDQIYAQVSVALRDEIHYFNTGKSLNPFGVFMCIALHTDQNGWAYPSCARLKRNTGISTKAAMSSSLNHLRAMRVDGHRVLATYRERKSDGQWGRTLYRIFPDAFKDGLANVPDKFRPIRDNLVFWNPGAEKEEGEPGYDNRPLAPGYDDPPLEEPPLDHHTHEEEPDLEGEPCKEDHGIANVWDQVLQELRMQMTGATFSTWLAGSRVLGRENGHITVQVKNQYAVEWLSARWLEPIKRTLAGIAGEDLDVEFVAEGQGEEVHSDGPRETAEIVLEDNPNPEVECPACHETFPLKNLKRTKTVCPKCSIPLIVNTDAGQYGHPPKPNGQSKNLGALLGDECPEPVRDVPYMKYKDEALRAWQSGREHRAMLLEGLQIAMEKSLAPNPKDRLPRHRIVAYALGVYRRKVEAISQEVTVAAPKQPERDKDSGFHEATLVVSE
jgi:hypothetical protein